MLNDGAGIGLLPEGWAHALQQRGLVQCLRSQPALASLSSSYPWRRDDARPVVNAMKELVKAIADFSAGSLF
jgi:DNA-binding transcriptional LysR family regulator